MTYSFSIEAGSVRTWNRWVSRGSTEAWRSARVSLKYQEKRHLRFKPNDYIYYQSIDTKLVSNRQKSAFLVYVIEIEQYCLKYLKNHGNPISAICYLNRKHIDLLIMHVHSQCGISAWSFQYKDLLNSTCTVCMNHWTGSFQMVD